MILFAKRSQNIWSGEKVSYPIDGDFNEYPDNPEKHKNPEQSGYRPACCPGTEEYGYQDPENKQIHNHVLTLLPVKSLCKRIRHDKSYKKRLLS